MNQQPDYKAIVGIVLCVLFYFAYVQYKSSQYVPPPPGQQVPGEQTPNASVDSATAPTGQKPGAPSPSVEPSPEQMAIDQLSEEELRIETDTTVYRFSQKIGGLEAVILKNYLSEKSEGADPINLLDAPMAIQGSLGIAGIKAPVAVFHAQRDGRTIRFWRDVGDWRITQEFVIPESGYGSTVNVSFTNQGAKPNELDAALLMKEAVTFKEKKPSNLGFIPGMPTERQSLVWSLTGDVEREDMEEYCTGEVGPAAQASRAAVDFLGIDRHYFLKVLRPKAATIGFTIQHGQVTEDVCEIAIRAFESYGLTGPGETVTLSFEGYFGPKALDILQTYNDNLTGSIELGVFGFIARPLLVVIHGFYELTGNYGVAILILTFLLKILFYPLMKASSVSMHKMKKLNPQMQEIRERYKDDKQRQQQEIMKFMTSHKINPAKGCLPILPQIPVFFAFYQVLRTAIELRHAPFFGWIDDLSAMDPYFVTPILMGVAMLIQQKLTPTTGMDKTQEKILMFMPVMFTVFMLTLPAGMTLYMLTNTVIGIVQQRWLYHKLDKLES